MSQVRPGVLIAVIVFAAFSAYAYLAPATYRTSGFFIVSPAVSGSFVSTPEPLEAARRMSEAVLDRKMLAALSRERAGSSELEAQASSGVRRGLEIETSDGHSFSLSYRDSDAARSQRACNLLVEHAVELAPLVLVENVAARALDLKRQEQTQELAAFLALHPQVAAESPSPAGSSPDKDAALSVFHGEKANLEHRIAAIESGTASDNPYVDPRESDLKLLRRRLAEIDSALDARARNLRAKTSGAALSPEIRAEWKRLLGLLSESRANADAAATPTLVAKVTASAPLPGAPIEPNRRLLLFFGVVFGVGLGAAYTLAARAALQRRATKSSRPTPSPTWSASGSGPAPLVGRGFTVQLPSAPGLPTGLGPPVPLMQPRSNPAPPIVPIPQRMISSSPPDALGSPGNAGHAAKSSSAPPQPVAPDPVGTKQNTSSRPPARLFASTLVLPPTESPLLEVDPRSVDPVLASAERAWDQQIRAHDVPGFAVVKPVSGPPQPPASSVDVSAFVPTLTIDAAAPAAASQRPTSRPPNQMKVTQPLGSFSPELDWVDRSPARGAESAAQAFTSFVPPGSPVPPSPSPSSPALADSQYSYVSSSPPPPPGPESGPPLANVIRVEEVARGWHPDRSLTPVAQRGLCEQLYPFAVESCFVLAVVGVPEAVGYKSRVAAELALALAESLHPRILLLEGDLHRPWVQRMIGVNMPISTGFSQQMNARAQGAGESYWTVLGCTKSLHVLAEGMMRSPGLLLSKQFANGLKELRTYYDFIVIDGPTTSLDLDSGALNAVADGVITVCPAQGSPALVHMQTLFGKKRFSAFATAP